jgi:HprK-related kinase A
LNASSSCCSAPGLSAAPAHSDTHLSRMPGTGEPLYFQIGAIGVGVRSAVDGLLRSYEELYRPYRRESRPDRTVEVAVAHRRLAPTFRKHYLIRTAGRRKFKTRNPAAVLPYLEWAINWQIMLQRPEFLQIHASVVQCDRGGMIFPGSPGSGKTTLAAGLLARGWRYLSDEFALIEPEHRRLVPYPKALCIKAGSYAVMERLGLTIRSAAVHAKPLKGPVRFLNPTKIRPDAVGTPCPIRAVVFPTYVNGADPCLRAISRAEAAFELNRLSFNFLEFGNDAFDLLAAVIRDARCYRLVSGDIGATCDRIESMAETLDGT